VTTRGIGRRDVLRVLALLVPVLGVPAIYYHYGADAAAGRIADRAAAEAGQAAKALDRQRAQDLAGAAALLLAASPADDAARAGPAIRTLLRQSPGARYRISAADGRTLDGDAPPAASVVAGDALIEGGRLAGGRVEVFLPATAHSAATVALREAARDETTALYRRTLLLTLVVLLAAAVSAWFLMARAPRAPDLDTGRSSTSARPGGDAGGGGRAGPSGALGAADLGHQELAVSRAFLDHVLDNMRDAVLVTTPGGEIRRVNEAACKLLGLSGEELEGRDIRAITVAGGEGFLTPDGAFSLEGEAAVSGPSGVKTVEFRSAPLFAGSDEPVARVLMLRDLSDKERSRERIRFLTRYDPLTRVANRIQFQHKLQQAIARAHRNGVAIALLYVDLDRFKDVNDTFGHPVGDRALEITARRLVDGLESGTLVGRVGGDEFAVLLNDLPASEDMRPALAASARTLLDRVAQAFYVERREIVITASIGIAASPEDADNVIDLIRNADAAMYHAKQSGGNTYGFYSPAMNADAVDRLMLKNELRRAMEKGEFQVIYQPKIDLRDGRVAGAEALLRWRHPQRGEVPPAVFIPLAEDSSLICEIGEWVLDRVCADFVGWQTRLAWPGRVAVNLSLGQLRQRDFVARIEQAFERHRLTPSCVELEITESTLMHDGEKTLRMLDRLYQLGLHLSIDDFGTGYSSLSALQDFPIGTLKIDRSFVQGAVREPERGAIVTTIISMGQTLKMDVVAEGVETEEQLEFLRRQDCTYAQGHLFGPPMTGDDYLALLVDQQRGARPLEALFGRA
jgi:diguanylate cyclase (GGDEF)-like protein